MKNLELSEPRKKTGPYDREANHEYLQKRQGWLKANASAMDWLREQGLTDKTIGDFKLGLSDHYPGREEGGHGDALVAPVPNADGMFSSCTVYLNIPSVTLNPKDEKRWTRGESKTYYSAKNNVQTSLLVLEELTDLWLTVQHLAEWNDWLNLLIVCPTRAAVHDAAFIPETWRETKFWQPFERVYLGFANNLDGDRLAIAVAEIAGREIHRLRLPLGSGKSWREFWNKGGTVDEFQRFLTESLAVGAQIAESDPNSRRLGRAWQDPVDVLSAFHKGHLYYAIERPFASLQTVKDGLGNAVTEITEKYVTEVVRSDRTIHAVREGPCPRGTPPSKRVLRLTDGTLLESEPVVSPFSTWTKSVVRGYLEKRFGTRPLKFILKDIKTLFKQSIWLPFNYDYDLLTLVVPVTFMQPVFRSVPMIYLSGSLKNHRSAVGRLMCDICSNAAYLADSSPSDLARLIHRAHGFVFLNEFDFAGRQARREFPLSRELAHALRLSYNRDSAIKFWVDPSTGASAEKLNLFGVKMFGAPAGADEFPNSPMLRIALQEVPPELEDKYAHASAKTTRHLQSLRDELHVWAFENVRLVDMAYRRLFPLTPVRDNDFTAPLKVFAELAGVAELTQGLVTALRVNEEAAVDATNPRELMIQAIKNLVREGYDEIAATHVSLEMKAILGPDSYRSLGGEQIWENAGWIGRELRNFNVVNANSQTQRKWLHGMFLRIVPIRQSIINNVLAENADQFYIQKRKPFDFCVECSDCRYRELNCPLQKHKSESQQHESNLPSAKFPPFPLD